MFIAPLRRPESVPGHDSLLHEVKILLDYVHRQNGWQERQNK